jgi:hydrogenase maturation protease
LQVEILFVHQLTPELAELASRATSVIFLDAQCTGEPGTVSCESVSAQFDQSPFSHQATPPVLLALCDRLYGAQPQAFVASLSGQSFDFGESLSPAAEIALPHFVATVRKLIERLALSSPCAAGT